MRPLARAYSHHGHGPRADQTGRIHISDFRSPRLNLSCGPQPVHTCGSTARISDPRGLRQHCPNKRKVCAVFRYRTASLSAADTLQGQTNFRVEPDVRYGTNTSAPHLQLEHPLRWIIGASCRGACRPSRSRRRTLRDREGLRLTRDGDATPAWDLGAYSNRGRKSRAIGC